jgi:hypothetical protein
MKLIKSLVNKYNAVGQRFSAAIESAPSVSPKTAQTAMFVLGVGILAGGLAAGAIAAEPGGDGLVATYNDTRIANSVNMILTYLEGSFGALIMVCAGIGAIMSAAFGQYKAALGCLVVAVGSFILRSFLGTFFNDLNITG